MSAYEIGRILRSGSGGSEIRLRSPANPNTRDCLPFKLIKLHVGRERERERERYSDRLLDFGETR